MNKQELKDAFEIAKSDIEISFRESDVFMGFGLPEFKPVYVTKRQVAGLIRYQCFQFNGGIDNEALKEIADIGRHKFIIVG